MNRAGLQQLADDRIIDAELLLNAGRWGGAYYLVGYAVECGLKSCILVRLAANPEMFFGEKKWAQRCWTHNVEELVRLADLESVRNTDMAANANLGQNWNTVKDWNEEYRYQQANQDLAEKLFHAITDANDGVMQWIKARW